MKDQRKKVKLSQLKIDPELTELRPVNRYYVSRYRQNYRSGAIFPEIIVDAKTSTIVSGNHRATAMSQEFGENYEITAIFKTYKNKRQIIENFVTDNVSHGNPLSGISKKLIICKLIDMGASNQEIAALLNVPVKKINKIGDENVIVIKGKKGCETVRTIYPVKHGPVIEAPITIAQYEQHLQTDLGVSFDVMADQILRWCKNGFIEKTPENINLCNKLVKALTKYVA